MNNYIFKNLLLFIFVVCISVFLILSIHMLITNKSGTTNEIENIKEINELFTLSINKNILQQYSLIDFLSKTSYPEVAIDFDMDMQFYDIVKEIDNDGKLKIFLFNLNGKLLTGKYGDQESDETSNFNGKLFNKLINSENVLYFGGDDIVYTKNVVSSDKIIGYLVGIINKNVILNDLQAAYLKQVLNYTDINPNINITFPINDYGPVKVSYMYDNPNDHNLKYKSVMIIAAVSILILTLFSIILRKSMNRPFNEIKKIINYIAVEEGEDYGGNIPKDKIFQSIAYSLLNMHAERSKWEKERREREKEEAGMVAIGHSASMIAHDVRKPLTHMKSLLALLPEKRGDDAFLQRMVQAVDKTIDRTNNMLAEILDFSKDATALQQNNHNPQSIITAALAEALRGRKCSDINIEYDLGHRNYLYVDDERVVRVLTNIIGNAVEAMDCRGKMWIKTEDIKAEFGGGSTVVVNHKETGQRLKVKGEKEENKKWMKITIGNNGPVIPEDVQQKMFEPFFTAGKKGGIGLGLAICQKIIDMHGGYIGVKSCIVPAENSGTSCMECNGQGPKVKGAREGRVTEFTIELPAAPGDLKINEAELIHHSNELKPFMEEAALREEYGDSANSAEFMKIHKERGRSSQLLIVDDEPLFRETIRTLLNAIPQVRDHVKVYECGNAEDALELFKEINFDYLIADIDMGKNRMNGYELTKLILEKYPETYVLIHSNKRREEMDSEIRGLAEKRVTGYGLQVTGDARFMGFLPKPMQRSELLQFLACKTFEARKRPRIGDGKGAEDRQPRKNILVLNDDDTLLMTFKIMLKSETTRVYGATNVGCALETLSKEKIDLILCDINLGEGEPDGYEFLRRVRERDKDIPFYMVSGYSRAEEEPKARAQGANGYMQLPLEKGQLEELI